MKTIRSPQPSAEVRAILDRRTRINTDIVARLLCAAFTLYPAFVAVTVPTSVSGWLQMLDGGYSELLFVIQGIIAGLIFLDVLCNSIWRAPPLLPVLSRHRDWLYLAAAFCAIVVPFSVSKFMTIDSGTSYLYIVIFCGSLALALCDAYAKKNTVTKKVRCEEKV